MKRLWWPFTIQRFSRDDCFSSVAEEITDVSQLAAIIFVLCNDIRGFRFFTCHVGDSKCSIHVGDSECSILRTRHWTKTRKTTIYKFNLIVSVLPPLSVFGVFYSTSITLTKLLMSVNPTPESTIPDKRPQYPSMFI